MTLSAYGRGTHARRGSDSWRQDRIAITENVLIPCLERVLTYQIQMIEVLEVIQGRIEGYAPTRPGSRCWPRVGLKSALNELNVLSQIFGDMQTASCAFHNPCTAARLHAQRCGTTSPRSSRRSIRLNSPG